jgi:hypothetical protein
MNRYYFRSYKLIPFKIEINNEKMICSDYFWKSIKHEILLSDIDVVEGGALSGTPAKPTIIHSAKDDIVVGISPHLKNQNKLITIILSNVKQDVYNNVLDNAKQMNEANKALINKASKGKKKPTK